MSAEKQLALEAERAAYWVRKAAADRGISLEALAIYSGVARSSVVAMGRGKNPRTPALRTLASVAYYLGVDVRDLLAPMPDEESGGEPTGAGPPPGAGE